MNRVLPDIGSALSLRVEQLLHVRDGLSSLLGRCSSVPHRHHFLGWLSAKPTSVLLRGGGAPQSSAPQSLTHSFLSLLLLVRRLTCWLSVSLLRLKETLYLN